jgi:hypothetical protein
MLTCIFLILFIFICCNEESSVTKNLLEDGNKITAAYKYGEVNSLANPENKSNGLILESIRCKDIDENGTSEKWIYAYNSAGIAVTYKYQATKDNVMQDGVPTIVKIPPNQLISSS